MKNTCKILALVLVLMTLFAFASMFTASAESDGETWSVVGPLTGGWDAGAAPEMTYDEATGAYVLVLYNVQAGKYEYKVIKDKTWGVKEYPSSGNYSVEIKENGSTVTVKLLNNTVTVEQEVPAPCEHDFSAGNICLESVKCSKCDVHSGTPKAHTYGTDTVCDNCGFDHTQTHKVYFKNTPNWATVTVHNWSDAGGGTTWPGSLATKEGDFYVFEIPAGRDMCIFNNNDQGAQTANLLVPAEPMVYNFETQKWEELPHTHTWVDATCVSAKYCSTCFATEGEPNPEGHFYAADVCYFCKDIKPSLIVGDNPVVVPEGSLLTVGIVQITDAGTYKVTCADTTVCIFYTPVGSEGSDFTAGTGASWQLYAFEKDLEPGYYYIGIYTPGEYTVTISRYVDPATCEHEYGLATCVAPATCSKCGTTQGEPNPDAHYPLYDTCLSCGKDLPSFKLGDNHIVYVPGSPTLLKGDYYAKIEFTEPGTYVLSGVAPMKGYLWTVPTSKLENGQLTTKTPYAWNVDVTLSENEAECLAPSFEVTITEAGVYWVGFNFDYVGEQREFDINVSLKAEEQPPVDEPTEDPKPEEPKDEAPAAPEMNFFQKIIAWFMDLIQKLLAMFKK